MVEGNPYKVLAKRVRRRFRAEAVGLNQIETVNLKTGEVGTATQLIGSQKVYDSTDFIKLYDPHIFCELSVSGTKVLSYIISELQFGGYVAFDYTDCMEYTGYDSRKAVCSGLKELKDKDIIRAKKRGEWWVNPNIVYRGQRDEIYAMID